MIWASSSTRAVGVMCSGGAAAALAPDVAASLVGALQQSCLAFCSACYALGGAGAGPTLRQGARKLAAGVVEPCVALLKAMVGGGLGWLGAGRGFGVEFDRPAGGSTRAVH
jgi:hypothetical protein